MWQLGTGEQPAMAVFLHPPCPKNSLIFEASPQSLNEASRTDQYSYPYQVVPSGRSSMIIYDMGSTEAFAVTNSSSQSVNGAASITVGPQYHPSPMYMPQWGNPSGYPNNCAKPLGAGTSMQYVYSPYHTQHIQHSIPSHSVEPHMPPTVTAMSPGSSSFLSNGVPQFSQSKVPPASPMPVSMPFAPSSTPQGQNPMSMPYYLQGGGAWPHWTTPNADRSHSLGSETLGGSVQNQPPMSGADVGFYSRSMENNGNGVGGPVGESRKTMQRRQQRLAKKTLQDKSTEWPMKVAATASGEIDPACRLFVQKMIRASARRFLKLTVIKFRDHPDEEVQNVKKDLEKRFTFDKNLRPDFLLGYVETSMKNARYEYHKYWLETGKGKKHEDCPEKAFPELVKYWLTKEAEEEIREHRAERVAAREKINAIREERGITSTVQETSWNPFLEDNDPDYLKWDDTDISQASESRNQLTETCTPSNPASDEANVSTPVHRSKEDETPSSKGGSVHPNNDTLSSQRSLDQQLLSVQTRLNSISQRQDTLQNKLDANVSGMASMERKLDIVLQMHASLIRSSNSKELLPSRIDYSHTTEGTMTEGMCVAPVNNALVSWQTPPPYEKTSFGSGPSAKLGGPGISERGAERLSSVVEYSVSPEKTGTPARKRPCAVEMAFGSFDDPMLTKRAKQPTIPGDMELSNQKLQKRNEMNAEPENTIAPNANRKTTKSKPKANTEVDVCTARVKRKINKPSRYLTYVPPAENKRQSEKCEPLKPRKNVWILHPEFPNETIAIGKSGPHWRSAKKIWIPNVANVSWEPGMQQVTIDHIYPQYMNVEVLHPNHQREGIIKISDALDGAFAEDATLVWKTRFLKFVET